jgi:GNAT superfamily N-acetyltransferase
VSGYRFCRTDDIPLLVQAFNACWTPRFGAEQAISVESFKRDVRALNLWASSSMLAIVDDEPVAVLLGAKREDGNLVHRIAVKPGHARQGHGRHLVESLRQKVAILGPPHLAAEVPAEWAVARRFLESCGFRPAGRYVDFAAPRRERREPAEGATRACSPVTFDELRESGVFDDLPPRAWERSPRTLANRRTELDGIAIASDVRIEAYLLHRPAGPGREIVALGESRPGLLRLLLDAIGAPALAIPKLAESEAAFASLETLGFRRGREWIAYALDARA